MPQRGTKKSDPAQPGSQRRLLAHATRQLANLLVEAMPLAELLNADETPHQFRSTLRDLVGHEQYFELANTLHQMCSMRGWEIAHARDAARREQLRRPGRSGVTVEGASVRFHRHSDTDA